MITLKNEILENNTRIRHYAEDENGKQYKILQSDTGIVYDEAVDIYPTKHVYEATSEEIYIEENVIEPVQE